MSRAEDMLSFSQAQRMLAKTAPRWGEKRGQRLKRYVLKREKAKGKEIAIRHQGPSRTEYRITWSILRRECPELFESHKAKARMSRDALEQLEAFVDRRISELLDELIEPRLRELWRRDEQIRQLCEKKVGSK